MKKAIKVLLLTVLISSLCGCMTAGVTKKIISENKAEETVEETQAQTEEEIEAELQEVFDDVEATEEVVVDADDFEVIDTAERFVPEHGLQVIGANICDENGEIFQLKGISTHGIQWFPQYINQDLFTQMHTEWNCNVVRIANYVMEYDGYCNGGDQNKLKGLIDDAVKYATNEGMYSIIDWHVMREGDPRLHTEEAIEFFDEMSKKYADNPYVIYEICNEPNGKGINWDPIYEYAEQVIPVIRANSPYSVIIVGTPMYSAAPSEPFKKVLPYDNLAYAYHFYAKSHRESRMEDVKKAYNEGVPLIVSEFGTVANSGSGNPDDEMADRWIELLDELGIGYICWNLSNNEETSAIIVADCDKVSGFTYEELKPQGQWLVDTLTNNK